MGNDIGGEVSGSREWWVMVALLAAGFVVCAFGALREATNPGWQDTSGYLAHALYIAEHGGFRGFLEQSFAGTYPIVERHPAYMLLLAPFAERTPEFFLAAKLITLATGLVTLLTLVWMVARRYGKGAAITAGLLYSVSSSLVVASSHVDHEPLLVLCTLWTWWFLTETDRRPTALAAGGGQRIQPATEMPASVARWAIAGLWLGLAYMVKSTALLMGVAILVAACGTRG